MPKHIIEFDLPNEKKQLLENVGYYINDLLDDINYYVCLANLENEIRYRSDNFDKNTTWEDVLKLMYFVMEQNKVKL